MLALKTIDKINNVRSAIAGLSAKNSETNVNENITENDSHIVDLNAIPRELISQIESHIFFDASTMDSSAVYTTMLNLHWSSKTGKTGKTGKTSVADNGRSKSSKSKKAVSKIAAPTFDTSREEVQCINCKETFIFERSKGCGGVTCILCGASQPNDIFFGPASTPCGDENNTTSANARASTFSMINSERENRPVARVADFFRKSKVGIFLTDDQIEAASRHLLALKSKVGSTNMKGENELAAAALFVTSDVALTRKLSGENTFPCAVCSNKFGSRKSAIACCRSAPFGTDAEPVPLRRRSSSLSA